jgi:hypothetical protein
LTCERLFRLVGADPQSGLGSAAMIVAVVIGSLAAGFAAERSLRPWLAPEPPAIPAPRSPQRLPRTRAERIGMIDLDTIPDELRLRPLPPKRG